MNAHRIALGKYDRNYHLWWLPEWRDDLPPACGEESVRPPANRHSLSNPASGIPFCPRCLEIYSLHATFKEEES